MPSSFPPQGPCKVWSPRFSHGRLPPPLSCPLVLRETFPSAWSSKCVPDHPQSHCSVPLLALLPAAPKSRALFAAPRTCQVSIGLGWMVLNGRGPNPLSRIFPDKVCLIPAASLTTGLEAASAPLRQPRQGGWGDPGQGGLVIRFWWGSPPVCLRVLTIDHGLSPQASSTTRQHLVCGQVHRADSA